MMNGTELRAKVAEIVASTPVVDIHTHLFPPAFGGMMLRGIDELLTYHYLVAETLRYRPEKTGEFWRLPLTAQADLVWETLFLERSPVSEACRGVLTTLKLLGLDTSQRNLAEYREFFAGLSPEEHVDLVCQKAGVKAVVMTNDPFDPEESGFWRENYPVDRRFFAALRLDVLLNKWPEAAAHLQAAGYAVDPGMTGSTFAEVRRFLEEWAKRIARARANPLYLAVSLPPAFAFPEEGHRGRLLEKAILPFCRESGLPLALMIGVKKLINPALRLAGDSVGRSRIETVEKLCAAYPENRFLVTFLSRENQHELCVAARKFGNLMPFGCWWFLNTPGMIREITGMRLELLGLSFIPQHSDARVLDQLVYKWDHSRKEIARVLTEKYEDLAATGWQVTEDAIRQDVEGLFSRNFQEFLGVSI